MSSPEPIVLEVPIHVPRQPRRTYGWPIQGKSCPACRRPKGAPRLYEPWPYKNWLSKVRWHLSLAWQDANGGVRRPPLDTMLDVRADVRIHGSHLAAVSHYRDAAARVPALMDALQGIVFKRREQVGRLVLEVRPTTTRADQDRSAGSARIEVRPLQSPKERARDEGQGDEQRPD